jgi:hypothetical protein
MAINRVFRFKWFFRDFADRSSTIRRDAAVQSERIPQNFLEQTVDRICEDFSRPSLPGLRLHRFGVADTVLRLVDFRAQPCRVSALFQKPIKFLNVGRFWKVVVETGRFEYSLVRPGSIAGYGD